MALAIAVFATVGIAEEENTRPTGTSRVDFTREIRPLLSDRCFRCHGPDASRRKAKLRLDQRESAIDKGAITAGKPDESEMISRIFAEDETIMPPE